MEGLRFFVGLHQPSDASHFERACISIRRLWKRVKPIHCLEVLVDSAAFTELLLHGRYREGVSVYAQRLYELHTNGIVQIAAAVAQDYMCEPFMLAKTGLTVLEHQRLTIERYDHLVAELVSRFGVAAVERLPFPVMPVLQGYAPEDYARHVGMYGDRLRSERPADVPPELEAVEDRPPPGMWVGVGSVCKRNGKPERILEVLCAIHSVRPDLRLHGFGVKTTSLEHEGVRSLLSTADSLGWSFAARRQGRDANDWR
ncbi:MAG: DUF7221 family queuine tRNA-ribosyltransferase-like protein, partial [Bradyrhizobium sp.]